MIFFFGHHTERKFHVDHLMTSHCCSPLVLVYIFSIPSPLWNYSSWSFVNKLCKLTSLLIYGRLAKSWCSSDSWCMSLSLKCMTYKLHFATKPHSLYSHLNNRIHCSVKNVYWRGRRESDQRVRTLEIFLLLFF